MAQSKTDKLKIQGADIEVEILGRGKPLVLLHSEGDYEAASKVVQHLSMKHKIYMPRMPGFGKSTLPDWARSIDDISYMYLDLLDHYRLEKVPVLGFSVGGWIAAEMATKSCARIGGLGLVGALGVKFGGAYDRDIEDIYYHTREKVAAVRFHNLALDPRADLSGLSERQAIAIARQQEHIAKLCWDPYFHNPALKYRLSRISVPTLVVWGAKDQLTKPKYGRAYAKRIKGAKFAAIANAGHYPHIEQPDEFLRQLKLFVR
ncbi:MAG: alpha/beta hydrolase [Rhodospirillales bacterium]|nr:alpha/beta hydrolase [Rhodospirillales bacterium]